MRGDRIKVTYTITWKSLDPTTQTGRDALVADQLRWHLEFLGGVDVTTLLEYEYEK